MEGKGVLRDYLCDAYTWKGTKSVFGVKCVGGMDMKLK